MKAVIFDCDGMINIEKRFSKRLSATVPLETSLSFFKNEFQQCLVGKADLKEELKKVIPMWGWRSSVEDLLALWFADEANMIQQDFEPLIQRLRSHGIATYLATNNEKYRTEYLMTTRGIGKWFDHIFSSTTVGFKKPQKEFYDFLFSHIPQKREKTLYWDDDPEHVSNATSFGIPSRLYTNFEEFAATVSNY